MRKPTKDCVNKVSHESQGKTESTHENARYDTTSTTFSSNTFHLFFAGARFGLFYWPPGFGDYSYFVLREALRSLLTPVGDLHKATATLFVLEYVRLRRLLTQGKNYVFVDFWLFGEVRQPFFRLNSTAEY